MLLHRAIWPEPLQVGPQVIGFLVILDACENHFLARNLRAGVFDVLFECRVVPEDSAFLLASV
jgi:hypothetical protein